MRVSHLTLYTLLLVSLPLHAATPPVQFTDITAEAGVHFRHINGAVGDYHLPETIGAGGAFLDYDNDGDLDLYLVNSGDWLNTPSENPTTSILYRNNGDATFTDVTRSAGVGNAGNYGQGVVCGDFDNDGDVDIYVTNFGVNWLYRNNGDGTFADVTEKAGVGDPAWSSSATFFDYDRDGYLDLYVVNYLRYSLDIPYRPCGAEGVRTYCHPSVFEGAPDRLYRNNGDGTFADVTDAAGVKDIGGLFHGKGLGVVAADLNNDTYPDLYVANDDTPNYLFYNNGDGTFSEIALIAGCAYSFDGVAQAGMGVDAGDYNGDGLLDIFITNLSYETNALYRNNGDGTFTDVIYEAGLGKESYLYVGFGAGFLDFDNDGHLDIFVANGHVIDNIEQTHDVLTYAQPNQLFHNTGDGKFTDISSESGGYFRQKRVSRGAVFGDYDNDGDTDIVVTQSNGAAVLLRNDGGSRQNWLRIKPVGTISNRDGLGGRVTAWIGGKQKVREVRAGSSYLSSNDPRLIFGLGEHSVVERLEIRWTSGIVQILENLPANQEIVISEENNEDFFRAVRANDLEAAQLALNDGINVKTTDRWGNTALIFAVHATENPALVNLLLKRGAEVNAGNHQGETALMYVASKGQTGLVKILLENGADVNRKNIQGSTALTLAESAGHTSVVRLLRSAGAAGAK
jgi:enediyne biosynthesis protein E4